MTPALENLQQLLKRLPGLGFRSAERVALHLLLEKPERLPELVEALQTAAVSVRRCDRCGNLAESAVCAICADDGRDHGVVCVVEQVPVVRPVAAGPHLGHQHRGPVEGGLDRDVTDSHPVTVPMARPRGTVRSTVPLGAHAGRIRYLRIDFVRTPPAELNVVPGFDTPVIRSV